MYNMTRHGVQIINHSICKKSIYVDRILPEIYLNEGIYSKVTIECPLVTLECSPVNIGAAQSQSYFPETVLNVSIISPRRRL